MSETTFMLNCRKLTRANLSAIVLLGALAVPAAAHADTVGFTYFSNDIPSGVGEDQYAGTVVGSGSFTYAGTPASLSLSSLSGFSFTDTFNITDTSNGRSYGTGIFTYSLSDLLSFSATLSGDELLTLSLQTDETVGSNPGGYAPESLIVISLAANGANTTAPGGVASVGTVTETSGVSPVPEPSSLMLLGTGLLGAIGATRRRVQRV